MVRTINIDTKARTIRVSNEDKDIDWITVKGTHVPIKKGESKGEAVEKFFEDKGRKFYRGSVVHKDTIDGLKKAKDKHSETMKYWESEGKKNHKEKGYADFVKKEIEAQKQYAKRLDESIADISRDFEIDPEDIGMNKEFDDWKKSKQPAKQEPYSDPFHKEAEQKRNAAKDAWLKAKPQVNTKKLRAGDPETFEKYMDWRWQATTLSDGYDEMMKDFGGRDEFNKAAQAYEKLKQPAKKETKSEDPRKSEAKSSDNFRALFEKYVPDKGKADTLFGEMMRAAGRIRDRYYRYGDMYGYGYGKTTVNNALSYLSKLAGGRGTELKKELDQALHQATTAAADYDEAEYERQVDRIVDAFANANWDDIKKLASIKNKADSLTEYPDDTSYDDYVEDEE